MFGVVFVLPSLICHKNLIQVKMKVIYLALNFCFESEECGVVFLKFEKFLLLIVIV